jgi:hypothetical protein
MNTCFIEYLNASKNFQKDIVYFEGANAYEDAVEWGKANLDNFNLDMIKIQII